MTPITPASGPRPGWEAKLDGGYILRVLTPYREVTDYASGGRRMAATPEEKAISKNIAEAAVWGVQEKIG